ncbi:hypothetical protein [Sphingobium aquiterrae]|uniref:hypothetical protein n=1 Tax=Sphingobium aquiterrae TaxID=2038656 RepID=UPI003015CE42
MLASIPPALETNALAITHVDALAVDGTADMMGSVTSLMLEAEQNAPHAREDIVLPARADTRYASIYRWGLDPRLLALAQAYLQCPVAYDGCELVYTPAIAGEGGARTWHRDREDWRVLKLIVYLNDVDDGGAPFQILNGGLFGDDQSGQTAFPLMKEADVVRALGCPIGKEHVTTCCGSAGTVVLVDGVRYFHRRKPPGHQPRYAAMFSYFSRQPRNPFYCNRSHLGGAQIRAMTADLSDDQQRAARWREALPLPFSLVPVSMR